jgi:Ca2+-binding RTX toxin-like protein
MTIINKEKVMKPSLENLESRLVPAKITMINSTTMMVDARQDAVPLNVRAESNLVLVVNGQKINTINVLQLNVQGSNYNDMVDLQYVTKYNLVSNTHNGNDFVLGTNLNDIVASGNGNDTLRGGNGNDSLYGENGDDLIYGENGDDLITGGDGNDTLLGGFGNDLLYGNKGSDMLIGGAGYDHFCGDDYNDKDEKDYIWTGDYAVLDMDFFQYSQNVLKNKNTIAKTAWSGSNDLLNNYIIKINR